MANGHVGGIQPILQERKGHRRKSRSYVVMCMIGCTALNTTAIQEVHVIHPFQNDFYAHDMSVLVLGYVRPELDYVSKEALISDINTDVKVALNSLARPTWAKYASHPYLIGRPGGSQGFNA